MWKYIASRKLAGIFAETLLLIFCVLAGHYVRLHDYGFSLTGRLQILPKALLIALVFQLFLHLNDIYSVSRIRPSKEYLIRLLKALLMATIALCVLFYAFPDLTIGRGVLSVSLILGCIFLILWHTLLRGFLYERAPQTNLLVLGTGKLAREAVKEILRHPELGINMVGFVDDNPEMVGESVVNPKVLGTHRDLLEVVAQNKIDRIIVGLQDRRGKLPIQQLLDLKTRGVAIEEVATFYERVAGKIPIENLKPSWIVFSSGFGVSRRLLIEKRILSIIASTILLLLFSPLMLLLMILIKLDSKGPIFYRQERVGQDGHTFMLWKFRSMTENAEEDTGPVWSSKGDNRITRMGRFMRPTRLDELPQLINVFQGHMSFVGPRPERPHFVQQLSEAMAFYPIRHTVKPGLTGWAQINYGYASSFDHTVEKLQYDLFYIKNMSWILDSLIILETVKTVLVKKGT